MHIWDRQTGESKEAFRWFKHYCGQPRYERSFSLISSAFGVSVSKIIEMSEKWSWRNRSELYDIAKDREKLARQRGEIIVMNERHQAVALALQELAAYNIERMLDIYKSNPEAPLIKPDVLVKIVDAALKIERVARGEPATVEELRGNNGLTGESLSNLSTEDLKVLKAIKERIEKQA